MSEPIDVLRLIEAAEHKGFAEGRRAGFRDARQELVELCWKRADSRRMTWRQVVESLATRLQIRSSERTSFEMGESNGSMEGS
jgi:hypothetical protein